MHFVIRFDKFYQKLHLLIKDNLSKLEFDEIKAPRSKNERHRFSRQDDDRIFRRVQSLSVNFQSNTYSLVITAQ